MCSRAQEIAKRILDVIVSGAAMILLCPLLALIALSIRVSMGPSVLFRQTRAGYRASPFTVLKFRTMSEACDSEGNLLPDPDRLTPLGSFLRRWSLDELPQLWNVFKGDMSLVGPRPLLMEYLEKYTPEQARRHDVKPGLTGWAQLHGRQDLLFSKRFEMDVWYVDHWSFLLDLKLIFITLLRLPTLSAAGADPDVDKTDDLGLFALIRKQKKKDGPIFLP
jgi:sugar transferase EpsL